MSISSPSSSRASGRGRLTAARACARARTSGSRVSSSPSQLNAGRTPASSGARWRRIAGAAQAVVVRGAGELDELELLLHLVALVLTEQVAAELREPGDADAARQATLEAVSVLDKAAEKGVLHKNNAARRKSRLMRRLAALQKKND